MHKVSVLGFFFFFLNLNIEASKHFLFIARELDTWPAVCHEIGQFFLNINKDTP
jgi:hypothetical protein